MVKNFIQNQSKPNFVLLLNAVFLTILVLFDKANPMAIVFAYVFETAIIGLFHSVKLFFVIRYGNQPGKKETHFFNYLSIPFFIIHFGAFVAIQSLFLYILFASQDAQFKTSLAINNLKVIFNLKGFSLIAYSIIATHLADFFLDFIKHKKYYHQNLGTFMTEPYTRIFIQQFLAIIPFFFLIFTNKVGIFAAIFLIFLRTIVDFYLNNKSSEPSKTEN